MGTSQIARLRRRLGVALCVASLLTPALVVATASPASAAPTISVSNPSLAPGGATIIEVDGSSGYDGAFAFRVFACGNADASGTPLALTDYELPCHLNPTIPVQDGYSGTGNLIYFLPQAGVDYSFTYAWPSVFEGLIDGTCVSEGNFDCEIRFELAYAGLDGEFTIVPQTPVAITPGSLPIATPTVVTTVETEADHQEFVEITLDSPAPGGSVSFTTYPISATSGVDYSAPPHTGTIHFSGTQTTASVPITIFGDAIDEDDETLIVVFSNPDGMQLGGFFGLGGVVIIDDDAPPEVELSIPTSDEGDSGSSITNIIVSLSEASGKPISMDWTTGGYTATDFVDFIPDSGSLSFAPGDRFESIPVQILGDLEVELAELVLAVTSNMTNAVPGSTGGVGGVWIVDEERCLQPFVIGGDYHDCDFSGQLIANVNVSSANFEGADFTGAQLIGVDFRNAELGDAIFRDALIANSNMSYANAVDADFQGVTIVTTPVKFANFHDVNLIDGSIVNSSIAGTTFAWSTITGATFLADAAGEAYLAHVTWGTDTICPDGSVSGDHADTCNKAPVEFRAGSSTVSNDPVVLTDTYFYATFHNNGPVFDPADLGQFASEFEGPIGSSANVPAVFGFYLDSDNDGHLDRTYGYEVAASPLAVGSHIYCATATLNLGGSVYGCDRLTVLDEEPTTPISPPASPPASPPSSPTTSPPISGGGALAGLLPLLSGPVGLMATAGGVGLLFLLGSNRAAATLEGNTREDDDLVD